MGKGCDHHHKHCHKGDCECHRHNPWLGIIACLVGFVIVVLLVILITWLVLRPTKPKFYLHDATVYSFNTSGGVGTPPNLLNANIQVTIASRNPNDRIGIYYDRLDVYAVYKYQQITPATAIPRFYHGHNDVLLWSPFLCSVDVPLAPYLAACIQQDLATGLLQLYVKLVGRVRWKVGSWTSGRYHLFVNCPALLTFGGGGGGDGSYLPVVRFDRTVGCSVSV